MGLILGRNKYFHPPAPFANAPIFRGVQNPLTQGGQRLQASQKPLSSQQCVSIVVLLYKSKSRHNKYKKTIILPVPSTPLRVVELSLQNIEQKRRGARGMNKTE